jgi:hypothetical protein
MVLSPVTWPTHQRIREDAELALGSFWPGNASVSGYDLARYCLTLLAELEKVPALVEALRRLSQPLHRPVSEDAALLSAEVEGIARAALAAWDETP